MAVGEKGQMAVGEKGKQLAELAPCTFAACDRSQLAATSKLELYQIQETGRALFNYNILNTSQMPDIFQIIHSTEKI